MAIVWMDGFEQYTNDDAFQSTYVLNSTNTDTRYHFSSTTRFGVGRSLRLDSAASGMSKTIPASDSVSVGLAVQASNANSSNAIFNFSESANTHVSLFALTDGSINANRGPNSFSNLLGSSASGVIKFNVWQYIEVEFVRHASAGVVRVYVDGTIVLNLTGINTASSSVPVSRVYIGSSGVTTKYIDDFYITNAATRLGDCVIDTLVPAVDTAQKDFTPSTGSDNFACVDELPGNGDSDYVSVSTAGKKDLYEVGSMTGTASAILAISVNVVARKTASGFRSIQTELLSGSTADHGTEQALASAYGQAVTVHETDPATSAAWTQSAVNALQVGVSTVS